MGCAASRETKDPNNHQRFKSHASNPYYDWDKEEGGYLPYRFQKEHRRRWHQEDKATAAQQARDAAERERQRRAVRHYEAEDGKAAFRTRHIEQQGQKMAEDYGQQVRDGAERERNRKALEGYDVHEKKANLRRPHDEERRRERAAAGRTERIKVFASPDLRSR